MNFISLEVTFDNKKEALKLSHKLLDIKLVADAQLNEINSMFFWKNKFYNRKEYKVSMKTSENLFAEIELFVKANHSFKCPQIVAVPFIHGSSEYFY